MKEIWSYKAWLQIFGWCIGVISLYIFVVYFFDWQTATKLISTTHVLPVCASIFFFLATLFVRAFKWTYILRLKEHVSWKNGYHTIMISNMINFILPIRFGEVIKLYIINKVEDVSYTSSISATLTDKFSHLLIITIFLLFTPIAGFVFFQNSTRLLLFIVPLALFLVFLFVFGVWFLEILKRTAIAIFSLFERDRSKIDKVSESKLYSLCTDVLKKINISTFTKTNLLVIVFFSFITISLDGACFYFIIRAFALSVTWLQGILAACFMNLMFILPTPPGQIGTAEMYPVLIFSWGLSLPSLVISSVAILWHLLTSALFFLLGICSTVSLGLGWRSIVHNILEERLDIQV